MMHLPVSKKTKELFDEPLKDKEISCSQLDLSNQFDYVTHLNRNTVWCRTIVKELISYGVNYAVLCIGGRSAALAAVLSTQSEIKTVVYNDERAAAFHALGHAKATKKAVIICTTSGSAVANLIPALAEAYATDTPLILLTCDRPNSIRKSGAPQCTDHINICHALVNTSVDLCNPDTSPSALKQLRQDINRLLEYKNVLPLHLNIPQHGKLTSTDAESHDLSDTVSSCLDVSTKIFKQPCDTKKPQDISFIKMLSVNKDIKGLIFIGPEPNISAIQMDRLANHTGFPIMADAVSGMRRSPYSQSIITTADMLVTSSKLSAYSPDLIIRIGAAPVSHNVQNYLQTRICPVININNTNVSNDFLTVNAQLSIVVTIDEFLEITKPSLNADTKWYDLWLVEAMKAKKFIEEYHQDLQWSECKAAWLVANSQGFNLFHVANSMSIRHVNLYCNTSKTQQKFIVNRGVSGIDGTISTFLGALDGLDGHGLLLLGDQAAAHDIAAFQHSLCNSLKGTICIMNNGGSAIFDLLSCASLPEYEAVVRNKPTIDFSKVIPAFGLRYSKCITEAELIRELNNSRNQNEISVIEISVPAMSMKMDLGQFFTIWRLTHD